MIGTLRLGRRARLGVLVALVLAVTAAVPGMARAAAPTVVDANYNVNAVACPSASQCTAVDRQGRQVTFNPTAPGTPTPTTVDSNSDNILAAVACPSATQCTAVANNGDEVTFNPTSPGTPAPVNIGNGWSSVVCASMTQCTAVGAYGKMVTFNPTDPGTPTPTPITIDGDQLLNGLDCPSATQCTAVDYSGKQVTFNPTAPGTPTPTTIDTNTQYMNGVACPSTSQCTAVDNSGAIVTFDPLAPGTPAFIKIFGGTLTGIACPSARQCTAVDNSGGQTTFDPTAPDTRTRTTIDGTFGLNGVACPSATQCTAVDEAGQQVTFDPTAVPPPTGGGGGGSALAAISNLTQSAKTWREPKNPRLATATRKKKVPVGTTFSYSLDKPAVVRLSFRQPDVGRLVGGRCVAQRPANKKKRKCTITAGRLTFVGHSGVNTVHFTGRVSSKKKLTPGKYTLAVTATTGPGQSSAPKTLAFTIVK